MSLRKTAKIAYKLLLLLCYPPNTSSKSWTKSSLEENLSTKQDPENPNKDMMKINQSDSPILIIHRLTNKLSPTIGKIIKNICKFHNEKENKKKPITGNIPTISKISKAKRVPLKHIQIKTKKQNKHQGQDIKVPLKNTGTIKIIEFSSDFQIETLTIFSLSRKQKIKSKTEENEKAQRQRE